MCTDMESKSELRFSLFEQIKETMSAHLSDFRKKKKAVKLEHLGGCRAEPSDTFSS